MSRNLVKLDDYGLITFSTTTQALKAEKVLQAAGTDFLVIPIPREISASCGLAVKTHPDSIESQRELLLQQQVVIEDTYRIKPGGKGRQITRIPM